VVAAYVFVLLRIRAISSSASEAAEPRNEIEAALAVQMACTHAVTMAVLSRAGGAHGGDRHIARMASASARLLNAFANQVETMRRLHNGGTPVIRVERIEVSDSAQAIIGNISSRPQRRGTALPAEVGRERGKAELDNSAVYPIDRRS
jgi:hypothetical protein